MLVRQKCRATAIKYVLGDFIPSPISKSPYYFFLLGYIKYIL